MSSYKVDIEILAFKSEVIEDEDWGARVGLAAGLKLHLSRFTFDFGLGVFDSRQNCRKIRHIALVRLTRLTQRFELRAPKHSGAARPKISAEAAANSPGRVRSR